MANLQLEKPILKQIDAAVNVFIENRDEFKHLAKVLRDNLVENKQLSRFIHSTKFRAKKKSSLREKLVRKSIECVRKNKPFEITKDNLFKEYRYRLVGKPVAHTWDFENKRFFETMGLKTTVRDSMYTSIHYVVEPNRRTKYRCELQVRTLMEEVWGEVSHTINYPYENDSVTCQEQLRVLARVASGCTRLVDSIFLSYNEHKKSNKQGAKKKKSADQ